MNVQLHYCPYSIPLAQPLKVGQYTLKYRQGLLIRLTDSEGAHGSGEISPLPGLHRISLKDCLIELKSINTSTFSPSPCTKLGIELAQEDLKAKKKNMPMAQALSPVYSSNLLLNGLLAGNTETVLSQAQTLLGEGYRCLKLKVGRQSLIEDIESVKQLKRRYPEMLLRLDANQAWEINDAIEFGKALSNISIDYIEEPFQEMRIEWLEHFYKVSGFKVALDESLFNASQGLLESQAVSHYILKPSLWGSLEKVFQLKEQANQLDKKVVVTSTFESGLGLRGLAHLACALNQNLAVGLGTAHWLENDTLTPHFKNTGSLLNLEDIAQYRLKAKYLNSFEKLDIR